MYHEPSTWRWDYSDTEGAMDQRIRRWAWGQALVPK
jgi:hypothetical protein